MRAEARRCLTLATRAGSCTRLRDVAKLSARLKTRRPPRMKLYQRRNFFRIQKHIETMDTASFPSDEEISPPPDYTATISRALGSFIESKSATFACGGSIPIRVCSVLMLVLKV
jgi:hypothetical protein